MRIKALRRVFLVHNNHASEMMMSTVVPQARAMRAMVRRDGLTLPCSMLEMWLSDMPLDAASAFWVSPAASLFSRMALPVALAFMAGY